MGGTGRENLDTCAYNTYFQRKAEKTKLKQYFLETGLWPALLYDILYYLSCTTDKTVLRA
jgi:hypothetical protein